MTKKNDLKLHLFVPYFVTITLVCALLFLILQQALRLEANEPLVQIAKDLSNRLAKEESIPHQFPAQKIDMSKSLATFIYVYDTNKQLIGSTAALDGNEMVIPQGAIEAARKKGDNRITWQPAKNVRNALVILHFKGQSEGFVAAGKSLMETEKLIAKIQLLIGIGWFTTLLLVFVSWLLVRKVR